MFLIRIQAVRRIELCDMIELYLYFYFELFSGLPC
nr:MAG TPA: hypothetical protein [Bacteriophage sp.]